MQGFWDVSRRQYQTKARKCLRHEEGSPTEVELDAEAAESPNLPVGERGEFARAPRVEQPVKHRGLSQRGGDAGCWATQAGWHGREGCKGGGDRGALEGARRSRADFVLLSPCLPDRPPSPVNVTVTQLKANSATVSWDVPEGDVIIGYAISQQRQDGQVQRFIREVNTTNRACVLWDLAEDADYVVQVQSIGLHGESQASKRVHFRTLKQSERLPSNSSNQGDITMEGLDKERQLQTGEIVIIVAVLLMWAAVIALFCKQYDIIKDNDSNNNKEKSKPSSEHSTPERPVGGLLRSKKKSPSVNIIEV
ncbi:fibronectin type III domain-containing protein 4 [Varanus komodoensis]|uniref:fibronectin type III domain-containing protein 4 n=1 Tax=Varanus komodoensis TaxID=61221 RepID=UPI001CF7E133|nr:fibronectin type III domain-containing protein 4 [Varanus komodoensis]